MLALDRTRSRRLDAGRRARSTSRWQAVAAALAFVLSSLFGLIHEATTTHVRCAQHGELIDGDMLASAAPPARPTRTASVDELGSTVRDAPAVATHGHEHCTLISATRESRVVPRAPAVMPAPVAIANLAAAPPRLAAAHGRVLYRTAPKTSPPA